MSRHRDEGRGAQGETAADREEKRNPANRQDLDRPPEGRDEAPSEAVERGKRSPDSPWMGGG